MYNHIMLNFYARDECKGSLYSSLSGLAVTCTYFVCLGLTRSHPLLIYIPALVSFCVSLGNISVHDTIGWGREEGEAVDKACIFDLYTIH